MTSPAATDTAPVLAVRGLEFGYADTPPVFRGLELEVPTGGVLAVLGPNGGGKTTLLRLLAGSLAPKRGRVLVDGEPVRPGRRGAADLRRRVQLVFQDPDDQLFSASVRQDVSFGPVNQGLDRAEAAERVDGALAALGLDGLADRPVHLLSYGQRKRVALAGALAMRPSVLVLDEPTAGLDPMGVEAMLDTLDGLRADGATLVVSTHDVDLAYRWAQRVALIDHGLLAEGAAREVLADRDLLSAARLRPAWGPAVEQALRNTGLLAEDEDPPSTPDELAALLG
ncbi:energy-coupling factor ABC transporter ATP-binding protein [Nocardiopsis suaedae]|uniref:ABC transporter ATP-binding protein n=1 Tax=Nocardiopsis suaedae TaxID=3018444 RepID=A0ABT4TL25_9ACTN|nr:ABC transporter ATP-binding protein [Nocardiopsis suaedae]MDA2805380.1 ABC transporter ATP-binding protein [Nocardiopsis suaedae]